MNDSSIFINPRTPGYRLATINNLIPAIEVLFDKAFSGVGGVDSFSPFITCSEKDASNITRSISIVVTGEVIQFKAASNPEFDGTGMATVRLEEI